MPDKLLPDDVREFIQHHIDSVAQLEALLFLHDHPDNCCDVPALAKRLYAGEDEIAHALQKLSADGLLKHVDNVYAYDCPEELRRKMDRLADA